MNDHFFIYFLQSVARKLAAVLNKERKDVECGILGFGENSWILQGIRKRYDNTCLSLSEKPIIFWFIFLRGVDN